MKKQKSKHLFLYRSGLVLLLLVLLYLPSAKAQTESLSYDPAAANHYYDRTIGAASGYIYLEVRGADGGDATSEDGNAGKGASVSGYISIGPGANEIPVGSVLRFIPGQAGKSAGYCGGGGGGSAIAVHRVGDPSSTWKLLMVAGGGGGAGKSYSGLGGNLSTSGLAGLSRNGVAMSNQGENGQGGDYDGNADSGGGMLSDGANGSGGKAGNNSSNQPIGGAGDINDTDYDGADGGFGFGGGGQGVQHDNFGMEGKGGGGGGYSGGGGGSYNGGGGGGGSYANSTYLTNASIFRIGSTTTNPSDGYAFYEYKIAPGLIQLASNSKKCLSSEKLFFNKPVELATCNSSDEKQIWYFDEDGHISLLWNNGTKLSLDTEKGAPVVFDYASTLDMQKWIYDGRTKALRSVHAPTKCLTLASDGSSIVMQTCTDNNSNQQWLISGAEALASDSQRTIRVASDDTYCIDLQYGNTTDNTQLLLSKYTGSSTTSQHWTFDGLKIASQANTGQYIDLLNSNTSNGTSINLYHSQSQDKQNWIYDGLSKTFRSKLDLSKCMTIEDGNIAVDAKIVISDCDYSTKQQFLVK